MFAVTGTRLRFVQKVYVGDEPTSLTIHDNLVYVLDGSVASNSIRGFRRGADGRLTAINKSIQPLSSPIAVPGDIEFSPDGTRILVTEKTAALTLKPSVALDSFSINAKGVASPASRVASGRSGRSRWPSATTSRSWSPSPTTRRPAGPRCRPTA